jgi:hypothetical protein
MHSDRHPTQAAQQNHKQEPAAVYAPPDVQTEIDSSNLLSIGSTPTQLDASPTPPDRAFLAALLHRISITDTARTTGNDVILDTLLLRLHTETAARRGGASP